MSHSSSQTTSPHSCKDCSPQLGHEGNESDSMTNMEQWRQPNATIPLVVLVSSSSLTSSSHFRCFFFSMLLSSTDSTSPDPDEAWEEGFSCSPSSFEHPISDGGASSSSAVWGSCCGNSFLGVKQRACAFNTRARTDSSTCRTSSRGSFLARLKERQWK